LDYFEASDRLSAADRCRRELQTVERQESLKGSRKSIVKSEARILKARERTEIFDSLLFEELDGICGPCHHREVVEEEEREMYRNLPADDWRNSTVFKRLLLLKGDRILIE
jgi:hypothetical protein